MQLDQPGADHGAVAPAAKHVRNRHALVIVLEQVDALADRLQHAELDPVVDQLHEVAGTWRPGVNIAALDRESLEDRLDARDSLPLAADHEAGAMQGAGNAAARAEIGEAKAARLHAGVAPDRLPQ